MKIPDSSRTRYQEYLRNLAERRAREPLEILPSHHSTHKGPLKKPTRSFWQLIVCFWGLLRGERTTLVVSVGVLTIATLIKLVPPAATQFIIDQVLAPPSARSRRWLGWEWPAQPWWMIVSLATFVILLSVLATVLHLSSRWQATRISKRVQATLRKQVFEHAIQFPLHRIHQLKSGGLASILREDAGSVGELIFSLLYNPWRAFIQLVGSLIVLACVDWRLLLGGLFLLPLIVVSHRAYIRRLRPLFRDIRMQREEIDAHTTEVFGGMRVVRGFGRQHSETGRFLRGNHLMSRQEMLAWWWSRGIELAWEIAVPVASAGILMYGGSQVLKGQLTLGELTMFLFYLAMLLGPMAILATSSTQFQSSLAALDRTLDLLEEPLEFPSTPNVVTIQSAEVSGRITLEGVSFRYPGGEKDVLHEITLDIPAGQTVAFVGPSGAGKTTLCNLIARFHDPTQGRILLDGRDLRDIRIEDFRRLLGIVEQDVFLFDGTVADNIGYGRREATLEEIQEAARVAHADEFIQRLEQGYETRIGERGVRLSGGQRQRIAIARAVLANPRLLILDEATSNLDTESEQLIQNSLVTLMQGRTSFVIAHRLSTIRQAHLIVVIDHGKIVEMGTHEELLARGGRYRDMVRLQLGPDAQIT